MSLRSGEDTMTEKPDTFPKVTILLRRIGIYLLGMFILALGVGVSVKSNLGISPVNSIPYVISRISGINQGLLTTIVFCGYILIQIVLLRRRFQIKNLFQVACATIFGYFVSLCNSLLTFQAPESYPVRLLLTIISVVLIAGGIVLYLVANLIPQPAEGLCLTIEQKSGWQYANIKTVFDCVLVSIAATISMLAAGTIIGLREGTLIAMLGVGKVIGFMSKHWREKLINFCFMTNAEQEDYDGKGSKQCDQAAV